LFCGDWFLAVHARNYFAKELLPLRAGDVGREQVCLVCWHHARLIHREDEAHVLLACPAYARARACFHSRLSDSCRHAMEQSADLSSSLLALLGSSVPSDWEALGELCGKIRQARRHNRKVFISASATLQQHGFCNRKAAWRALGRFVCSHGVFFLRAQGGLCPCMTADACNPIRWSHARWMPALDADLRVIVVRPFDLTMFRRLGQVRGELRRLV